MSVVIWRDHFLGLSYCNARARVFVGAGCSIVPFVPTMVTTVNLGVVDVFTISNGNLLFNVGGSNVGCFVVRVVLKLFTIYILVGLFSGGATPMCPIGGGFISNIFTMVSNVTVINSSFLTLVGTAPSGASGCLLDVVTTLFSVPTTVTVVVVNGIRFSNGSVMSGTSVFFIFPTL